MSWAVTTIGEHCTVTSSKRFHLSERANKGVPFYCSKEIIQKVNGEEITECDFIREEFYEEVKNKFGVPQKGDLLITTRGTYGIPYIYKASDKFYFADGNLTWLKDFDNQLNSSFLYYWINSHEGQGKIDAIAKGTAQKAVPISSIKSLQFRLPPYQVQLHIVETLSAYDDLIEYNQKQIKLLEEAAQRLYKKWFVDLHFPGYENTKIADGVPEGWSVCTLKNIISYEIGGGWGEEIPNGQCEMPAYVIRGTDIDKIKKGNFTDIPFRYHAENNLSARVLHNGDIIFEVSGGSKNTGVAKTLLITEALLKTWDFPVMCASFCKLIRCKDEILSQYLYETFQYWRSNGLTEEFEKKSASSIINYRWKDFLVQPKVLIPDDDLLNRYNCIAATIYGKIIALGKIIDKSKSARDLLLPRLMSGELEIKNGNT